jgi:hypothetical protein
MRHILLRVVMLSLVAAAPPALLAQGGPKNRIEPPDVPPLLQVPAGHSPFFHGYAVGTQIWICFYSGARFDWHLFGDQATLFQQSRNGFQQVATHFPTPNPYFNNAPTATWQHSQDSSRVWAYPIATSSDPAYVDPGAIPWRLYMEYGTEAGPSGGSLFTRTKYYQRVRTSGGIRPAPSECSTLYDIGRTRMVPYSAEYYFYERAS